MTIARVSLGDLVGASGVTVFRGVPYATASRFAPPKPAERWIGPRDATRHGPIAPQPPSRLRAAMGDFTRPQDEECLTLTIATPAVDDAKRAVMVFLHGGAYLSGAGSLDWYDGSVLAGDGDVVVVGVNYRLGALGFLHLPGIAEGNMGLQDMVAALRWVRDNIASFGGDPARVTLVGQSAGAHAIMCLLTMWETRGLFERAILQSTPAALAPHSRAQARANADALCAALDARPEDLATIPAARIVAAQMQVAREVGRFADVTPPFLPVFDSMSDASAFVQAAAGEAASRNISLIIGTTREEMHAFFAADPAMNPPDPGAMAARFAELSGSADAAALYRRRRLGATDMDVLGDLMTDHVFLFPSLALADAATDAGAEVWVYEFRWAPAGSKFKACHCIELPFVFGSFPAWADAAMLTGGDRAEMVALSAAMRGAWSEFAESGDPHSPGLLWPPYLRASRQTMCFDRVLGIAGDPSGAVWRGGVEG